MDRVIPELLIWYKNNARDLPWRNTQDPYRIWVSEIILQQTRVEQGMSFYMNFINNFNDFCQLASAPEDAVLRIWQGLGYYSRARNMMKAAEIVCAQHGGKMPCSHNEILALPGIGPYTAAAIASFAFGLPIPALDGNVRRVGSRFLGLTDVLGSSSSDKLISDYLKLFIAKTDAGIFNQAMIEIGARICKPQNPLCEECPLSEQCVAFQKGLQHELPIVLRKKPPTDSHIDYLWLEADGHTWLKKRDLSGIWKGLYEFPSKTAENEKSLVFPFDEWLKDSEKARILSVSEYKHQLTHRTIYARLWHLSTSLNNIVGKKEFIQIKSASIEAYPVHRLMLKFLEKNETKTNHD